MTQRVGVVRFPGTNCEFDTVDALNALGGHAEVLWHSDTDLGGVDAVVIPGGFAHGDYLRCGAIAQFSPIMKVTPHLLETVARCWGSVMDFKFSPKPAYSRAYCRKTLG